MKIEQDKVRLSTSMIVGAGMSIAMYSILASSWLPTTFKCAAFGLSGLFFGVRMNIETDQEGYQWMGIERFKSEFKDSLGTEDSVTVTAVLTIAEMTQKEIEKY